MKSSIILMLMFLSMQMVVAQQAPFFVNYPTLNPSGEDVYFTYEGDLWRVPVNGGGAFKLTSLAGEVIQPKVSPDGKMIAFSSNQYGNYDVYCMPVNGGVITQLTFHEAKEEVASWSSDSKFIYFTGNQANNFATYKVSALGGTPIPLFTNYFNNTSNLIELKDGSFVFNNTMESVGQQYRKRYRGGNNPELYHYLPAQNKLVNLTAFEGKDLFPSVDEKGVIYYQSDESHGYNNLFSLDNGVKKQLTFFDHDIEFPQVSVKGQYVVFVKNYQLYVYNVEKKKSELLPVFIPEYTSIDKLESIEIQKDISNFDVSPDNNKIIFVSRGKLFVSDIKGKFIQLVYESKERVMEVKWLKDNKSIIFTQTKNGYPNLYTLDITKPSSLKEVTNDSQSNRDLNISPNFTKAVYLSGRNQLKLLDLKTWVSKTIEENEFWAFQNSPPNFSPNGDYIVFTAVNNFEQDIFVYNILLEKTINLTRTGVAEVMPVWSPDGKYIYFASNRTQPSYPFGMRNSSIYSMALDWYDEPYKSDEFAKLFEVKNDSLDIVDKKKKERKKEKEERVEDAKQKININNEGILERIKLISNSFGTQNDPNVYRFKDKTYVLYNSNENEGKMMFYRTVIPDFEPKKTEKIHDKGMESIIVRNDKYYFLSDNAIYTYDIEGNKVEKIELKYNFSIAISNEFKQMFEEAWAGIEENFYAENFHGVDWKAKKEAYKKYLPYIKNRNDLRRLLNDMLGELNASHLGFNSSGSEEAKRLKYSTNELGVVFEANQPYKVAHLLRNGPAFSSMINLKEGDELISINGQKIDQLVNRDHYLTTPKLLEEIQLEVLRDGKIEKAKVHPVSFIVQKQLLYDEWIRDNKLKVAEQGNNRIAYSYMKNMTDPELESFLLDMMEQEQDKEALILDLRFNTGGNVHDKVLQFLSQRPYLKWQYRGGKKAPQSNFAPAAKPIVLLINEASLSDAEMTAAGFKALKLGTIIGKETYRWIIFTSAKGLVDGSSFRVPAWGCYTLEGDNLELTGVSPDIEVETNFLNRQNHQDPQLEKAVEHILKQLH